MPSSRLWVALVALAPMAAVAQQQCAAPPGPRPAPTDLVSDTRLLRRIALTLEGTTPDFTELEALTSAPSAEARQTLITSAIDRRLQSPAFYEQMVRFGHEWITIGSYTKGAQGDAYQGDMSGHLFRCGAGTAHAGAFFINDDPAANTQNVCKNLDRTGAATTQPTLQVEPWWAPGTMVTVVGAATSTATTVPGPMNTTRDCGQAAGGYYDPSIPAGCGCGPNLVWCSPLSGLSGGSLHDLKNSQRRHPFEEPARLLGHLAWHDRDLSDLVLGNYSVGTNWLRHLYVRHGRQHGSTASDTNATWWQASADTGPRDPSHPMANDPQAWREFVVEDLNPFFLSLTNKQPGGGLGRTFQFDPRTTTAAPAGLPSAGVLTMMGPNSSWPRERVRAARFLEVFACSAFSPPAAGSTFPPYVNDPATGGTCLHCHTTLDPAAIFFKRWDFDPGASYYVPWPFLGGIGRYRISAAWLSGRYPHSPADGSPGFRWRTAFVPGTVMTPVTPEQVAANPEAVLLDTMPQSYSLLGESGDGTMGPLGFGKVLVRSGAFDKCAVRKLYARVVGRELHPADEGPYIDALVKQFVGDGRKVRPFIRYLMTQTEFRRGL
ncbi:MAG: hypothetical protein Q8S33_00655 [Myxococcales bacterium]|nr:hypothetical protein [Myxococcales bacterium]